MTAKTNLQVQLGFPDSETKYKTLLREKLRVELHIYLNL